jgi:hypothetical protein
VDGAPGHSLGGALLCRGTMRPNSYTRRPIASTLRAALKTSKHAPLKAFNDWQEHEKVRGSPDCEQADESKRHHVNGAAYVCWRVVAFDGPCTLREVVLAARGRYDSSSVLQTELGSSLFARRNLPTIILYLCAIGDAIVARALPVLSVDLPLVMLAEGLVQ